VHALAHNRDPRRVRRRARRRSIGSQRAIGPGPHTPEKVDATLVAICDRVARRLRAARRVCRTVVLRLRFDDFTRATRSHTLAEATAHTRIILATARELMRAARPLIERKGLTLVGLSLTSLSDDRAVQLAFPFERRRLRALDTTLDDVRDRYGSDAIVRGVLVGHDQGFSMPQLPD
jgi:DNA polymerase-4